MVPHGRSVRIAVRPGHSRIRDGYLFVHMEQALDGAQSAAQSRRHQLQAVPDAFDDVDVEVAAEPLGKAERAELAAAEEAEGVEEVRLAVLARVEAVDVRQGDLFPGLNLPGGVERQHSRCRVPGLAGVGVAGVVDARGEREEAGVVLGPVERDGAGVDDVDDVWTRAAAVGQLEQQELGLGI